MSITNRWLRIPATEHVNVLVIAYRYRIDGAFIEDVEWKGTRYL